jgi:hypothetical protein
MNQKFKIYTFTDCAPGSEVRIISFTVMVASPKANMIVSAIAILKDLSFMPREKSACFSS